VAAALCSRRIEFSTLRLDKSNQGPQHFPKIHTYWLLNDTCGLVYTDDPPLSNVCKQVVCPEIVHLYRIQNLVCKLTEDEDMFYSTMNETLLKMYVKEVENLKFPILYDLEGLSEEDGYDLLTHYEKTQKSLLLTLNELLTKSAVGLPISLDRQYSDFRQSSGISKMTRAVSSALEKAFQHVTSEKGGCRLSETEEEKQPSSPEDLVFVEKVEEKND